MATCVDKRQTHEMQTVVGVERHRTGVVVPIAEQSNEVGLRALAGHEVQLHEPAGRVVE
jgi:hypothetical protein